MKNCNSIIQQEKKKFLIIKLDYFNVKFIFFDIANYKHNQFINIIYKSPTIYLDCLILETPWIQNTKPIIENKNSDKLFLELNFDNYKNDKLLNNFYNILNSIDIFTYNFIKDYKQILNISNNSEFYSKNIKSNQTSDNILKIKLNNNFSNIIYNNQEYKNNIKTINIENTHIKCVIISYGLWKYNNTFGYSWKLLKISINDTKNNIKTNMNINKIINIPNFKLASDFDN